jgi:hypothetical protein
MDLKETLALLTLAAAFDQRTVGKADVVAWQRLLADVRYADAELAVEQFFASTKARLMPVDVLDGVKAIRAERVLDWVRKHGQYVPPGGLDPAQELEARKRWLQRAGDGLEGPRAITGQQ